MNFFVENLWEIIFGLIAAGALGGCKYFHSQLKEFKKAKKDEETRKYRQMIIDEIHPMVNELTRLDNELKQNKIDMAIEHKTMYADLDKVQAENVKNFNLIINSYKFRLVQLCRSHIHDGYITEDDFEQITEMHKLYTALGGNGQAQEYYDKVLELEIKPNDYQPE